MDNRADLTPLLFVHGAFQGGWVWDKIFPPLSKHYQLFTPTLTGLDDHSKEVMRITGLHDHITDICQIIDNNNLNNVVLIGHSYGGLVISGVGKARSSKIAHLIYLDALIPNENDSLLKIVGPENAQFFLDSAIKNEGWKIDPFPPEAFGLTKKEDIELAKVHHRPQSLKCFVEEISLPMQDQLALIKKSFILCKQSSELMKELALKAKNLRWNCYEMETPHCPMITHPEELAALLEIIIGYE